MSEIEPEIPEIPEIQETPETPEIDTEDEIPKKKAGRPKGSKNVAKAKAVKKPIEPTIENKIVKESTKPPVKHVHRKSRTRVIVLSSSSGDSDHKIRVVRKPAKRYEDSSDSEAPAKPMEAVPAPAPLESETPRPKSARNPANRFAFDIQADHQLRAAATKRTYDSFFSHLR